MLETLNVPDQYTILHYGALFNNVAFCRCLINDFGCNINLVTLDGQTALHIAARLMSSKYSEHPIPDIYGAIPLHYACRCLENNNVIDLFLNFSQLFNRETHDKKKPIDIMIEYNDPDVIKHFFDLRPENKVLSMLKQQYNEAINYDPSRLSLACRQLHGLKTISHLINPHSIMYCDKQTGLSPLMVAVQYRQLKCVNELLNNKYFTQEAFELVGDVSFCTVLHVCTKVYHKEITKALFNSRFMSNTLATTADVLGNTPLHTCAQVGNVYMTQVLLGYITGHNSSSYSPKFFKMSNHNADKRMQPESTIRHAHVLLTKKNKEKLTPLHVATQAGQLDVINEMLRYANASMINMCDDQQRTSLHMAAAKGHVGIVDILLDHRADSHVSDINEWTPLHHATRCSQNDEDNKERPQCITSLITRGIININALTIRRETPLHIACEYGSSKLVKQLIEFDCDLFATNVDGHNCLEVAVEANNEEVVRYLIENDNCFDLMRNSQIQERKHAYCSLLPRHCEVDTPMRKLIRKMPSMALLVLDKCSMIVHTKGMAVHKNIFVYEFLDDQFTVNKWNRDSSEDEKHGTLYTSNTVDLVMKHPLFLMAQYEAHDLMSHPLSNYLVKLKFQKFGIFLYIMILSLYITYLGLFTTIVLRTHHPATYYNLTNIDFEDSLCYNVSQVLLTSSTHGGIKTAMDYFLKYIMYIVIWSLVFKNMFTIVEIVQIDFFKTLRYWLETLAVLMSFIFVHDRNYQMNLTLRCPLQWEFGAFALLLSWLTLLGYIQFIPMLGLGFASTFYMIFQNFEPFQNKSYSYIKTALMISGELGFDERMFDADTKAYYKVAFLVYILFLLIMTVFVTNLLIGLAVGEIPTLMKQATENLTRLFYELVVICEIFRYRLIWILRRSNVNDAIAYSYQDLDKNNWHQRMMQRFMKRRTDDNNNEDSDGCGFE
ncbi:unnamed protein product [Adineta steineri]|uniref:Transient receptor potential cation channel subfamily A member 1 n=1 Tax=Adineta steineri TaxID=433720 RepID=A0A815C909_9BILA|nr:unnamed protein product [Adineta steineri]CAF1284049.1 unnamed protein product [Adineta steineri]